MLLYACNSTLESSCYPLETVANRFRDGLIRCGWSVTFVSFEFDLEFQGVVGIVELDGADTKLTRT